MALRSFTDSNGREWQAWDVPCARAERRRAERRDAVAAGPPQGRERRSHTDRRSGVDRRGEAEDRGWLCFESPPAKVRLAPVPSGWDLTGPGELEDLLRQARTSLRAT